MNAHLKIHEYFSSSKDADELWQRLHSALAVYGVTTIFYAVTHVAWAQERQKIDSNFKLLYYKSSFPKSIYVDQQESFFVSSDLGAMHCLYYEEPHISCVNSKWLSSDERAKRLEHEKQWYAEQRWFKEHARVGVSIPIRFGSYGIGGIGLQVDKLSSEEFDDIWGESQQDIVLMVKLFDELARTCFDIFEIKLTDREKEVIFWLSEGYSAKLIADQLGNKVNTVQNQIASLRTKLKASNNVQLVSRALTLMLL